MIDISGLTLHIFFVFLPPFQLSSIISGFFNGSLVEVEEKKYLNWVLNYFYNSKHCST